MCRWNGPLDRINPILTDKSRAHMRLSVLREAPARITAHIGN
jgi:hypothetical protein